MGLSWAEDNDPPPHRFVHHVENLLDRISTPLLFGLSRALGSIPAPPALIMQDPVRYAQSYVPRTYRPLFVMSVRDGEGGIIHHDRGYAASGDCS